jgi:large subunit ribosomal protein L25
MATTLGSSTCRVLARRVLLLQRQSFSSSIPAASSSNSNSNSIFEDPGKLVSGLTPEQVAANPLITEFLKVNFDKSVSEGSDGFVIPPEILKEYGYSVEENNDNDDEAEEKNYDKTRVDYGLGTPEQQAFNIRTLHTYVRTEEGTNACNHLRYDRMIPGMLYGSDPNLGILSLTKDSKLMLQTPWPEFQRELDRFHRRFESRVYELTVYEDESDEEGTVHRIVPRDVQRHPVQGSIYCANFLRYHARRPLKLPIVYINQEESPALKRDGYIVPVNKYVECFVEDGVPIPEMLALECTGLQLKDVVRMDRIIFPDGVRPTDRVDVKNFVVGPVYGGRSGGLDDDDDEKEAAGDGPEEVKV